MKMLKHFFECYFYSNAGFDYLDECIQRYKRVEKKTWQSLFVKDLGYIIQTKNYASASRILNRYGGRELDDLEEVKKFINFLYDRFVDRPTYVKPADFEKKFKGVFCPVCCPNPEIAMMLSLIKKATVIEKDLPIYICKPCKLIWLTKDIRADNAQDYKKFMRSLGLKGLWKELKDIDYL